MQSHAGSFALSILLRAPSILAGRLTETGCEGEKQPEHQEMAHGSETGHT